MKLLTAPIYALFSIDFYREVIAASLKKGFLYLLYLTLIGTFVFFLHLSFGVIPQLNRFVDWAKETMPPLLWTGGALEMSSQGAYTMVHPELGPLVTFDTSRDNITIDEIGDASIFVTATKVFMRQGLGELRVYELREFFRQDPEAVGSLRIDGDFVEQFYGTWKPWAVFSSILFYFPFFFVWKLLGALFYSLLGLLANLARRQKLPYRKVLNVTFFALTPVVMLQLLGFFIPFLNRILFGFIGALIVTWIYLFLGIKLTEGPESAQPGVQTF